MEIWTCSCGYTFIISTGNLIPEGIVGPIHEPDEVVARWWMPKPKAMTAHEWDNNYSDCSYRWLKEKLSK